MTNWLLDNILWVGGALLIALLGIKVLVVMWFRRLAAKSESEGV